jgi:hypothetical protein
MGIKKDEGTPDAAGWWWLAVSGAEEVATHRYKFFEREWKKEEYSSHSKNHAMHMLMPIPLDKALILG